MSNMLKPPGQKFGRSDPAANQGSGVTGHPEKLKAARPPSCGLGGIFSRAIILVTIAPKIRAGLERMFLALLPSTGPG